ncbi:hypothetical protein JG687_00017443, partial [Phytophthora cactorum]
FNPFAVRGRRRQGAGADCFSVRERGPAHHLDYVARRMRTQRTAKQPRLRLASLRRTYGKSTRAFPPCCFGGLVPSRLLTASGPPPPPPPASPLAQPTRSPS